MKILPIFCHFFPQLLLSIHKGLSVDFHFGCWRLDLVRGLEVSLGRIVYISRLSFRSIGWPCLWSFSHFEAATNPTTLLILILPDIVLLFLWISGLGYRSVACAFALFIIDKLFLSDIVALTDMFYPLSLIEDNSTRWAVGMDELILF